MNTQYVLKAGVRVEQSSNRIILIDDHNAAFYECSESVALLMRALFKGADRASLVASLLSTYDLSDQDAHAQVDYFLSLLVSLGMLHA